jgi:hypothetical protein
MRPTPRAGHTPATSEGLAARSRASLAAGLGACGTPPRYTRCRRCPRYSETARVRQESEAGRQWPTGRLSAPVHARAVTDSTPARAALVHHRRRNAPRATRKPPGPPPRSSTPRRLRGLAVSVTNIIVGPTTACWCCIQSVASLQEMGARKPLFSVLTSPVVANRWSQSSAPSARPTTPPPLHN